MTFSFPGRKQEGCIQPLLCFFNSSFIHVEFTATVWHPCLHAHYLAGCLGDARQDLYWCFGHLMKSAPYCCLWHAKKCMASRVGFFLFIIFANSAYDTTLWIPSPTVMLSWWRATTLIVLPLHLHKEKSIALCISTIRCLEVLLWCDCRVYLPVSEAPCLYTRRLHATRPLHDVEHASRVECVKRKGGLGSLLTVVVRKWSCVWTWINGCDLFRNKKERSQRMYVTE